MPLLFPKYSVGSRRIRYSPGKSWKCPWRRSCRAKHIRANHARAMVSRVMEQGVVESNPGDVASLERVTFSQCESWLSSLDAGSGRRGCVGRCRGGCGGISGWSGSGSGPCVHGSVLEAFRLERRLDFDTSFYEVGARDVEGAILDFAILAQEYARMTADDHLRPYEVRIVTQDPGTPLRVVDAHRYPGGSVSASHQVLPWSTSVWRFQPVIGELPGVAAESAAISSAAVMATDVLNQFGVEPTFLVT